MQQHTISQGGMIPGEEDGATTLPHINTHSSFNAFGPSSPGFWSLSPFSACIGVSTSSIQIVCSLGKLVSQGVKGSVLVLDCGAEDDSNLFYNVCS
jgi:hypothetical protein